MVGRLLKNRNSVICFIEKQGFSLYIISEQMESNVYLIFWLLLSIWKSAVTGPGKKDGKT